MTCWRTFSKRTKKFPDLNSKKLWQMKNLPKRPGKNFFKNLLTGCAVCAILCTESEGNGMRDFEWNKELWAVVKADGTFAGRPCLTSEEAWELSIQHEGSQIYLMTNKFVDQVWWEEE